MLLFLARLLAVECRQEHLRFTESAIKRLGDFKVDNFRVECLDFKESIPRHESDFLYLDPPYWLDQKLYGNKGSMHENFDHEALGEMIKKRNGWILSYNDCKEIRSMYKGHRFLTPEWSYGMNNSKKSNEVIILSKDFMQL